MSSLLGAFPDYAPACNDLGVLYGEQGDAEKALAAYEKSVSLDPENATFRKNLADFCYVAMKRPEEAVRHYERALSINPQDTETLLTLGNIQVESGDFTKAHECYLSVLEIDSANELAAQMFDALEEQGKVSEKRDPEALVRVARYLARSGQTDRAAHLLEKLLEGCADHAEARHDLGNLYCLLQKPEKALFHLERAVQLAPENTGYLRDLADAHLVERGNIEAALALYNRSLALKPDDVATLLRIGNICAANHQFEDARFFYGRVLFIEPQNATAQENIAALKGGAHNTPSSDDPMTDECCTSASSICDQEFQAADTNPVVSLRCFYASGTCICKTERQVTPDSCARGNLETVFDLSQYSGLTTLRLDPKPSVAVIKIHNLLLERKDREPLDLTRCMVTTGTSFGDLCYLFEGNISPQIGFSPLAAEDLKDAARLYLKFEYAYFGPRAISACINEMRRVQSAQEESSRIAEDFRKHLSALEAECRRQQDTIKRYENPLERKLPTGHRQYAGHLPTASLFNTLPTQHAQPGSIAVHLHLFYTEMAERLLSHIAKIPYAYDLYVTVSDSRHVDIVEQTAKRFCGKSLDQLYVTVVPNRGRDIAPFLHVLGKRYHQYDYVCHVHSKKSLRTGAEQTDWCDYLFESLFKDEDHLRRIFGLFAANRKIGLIYPTTHNKMPYWCHAWLSNKGSSQELFSRLKIRLDTSLYIDYPVGSMMWARSKALAPLFDLHLTHQDFPPEPIPNDGTLCHAIERSFCISAVMQNFTFAELDIREGIFTVGVGQKNLWQYWERSSDHLWNSLEKFNTVSFDVFDTVVTRPLLDPDHAFLLVQDKVERELNTQMDFFALRKKAEALARSRLKRGRDASLEAIYKCFSEITGLPPATVDRIRQIETETEIRLSMPRLGMREMIARLQSAGKKIVFLSDMYLSSDTLSDILSRQGYDVSQERVFVSSETGMRKDTGEIWRHFRQRIADVHVGDNEHSDVQMASDNGVPHYHVMSPRRLFEVSRPKTQFAHAITLADSMYAGPVVSRLFSSPFALHSTCGHIQISEPHELGYCVYGPILLYFVTWLYKISRKNRIQHLWFLSREGFLLKELFEIFSDRFGNNGIRSSYMLCSRRATSVPMIKQDKDIRTILEAPYSGCLANLLEHRLGIHPDSVGDGTLSRRSLYEEPISLPQQINSVFKEILNFKDPIYENAKRERKSYLAYLNQLEISSKEKTAVVDIGFAGTIQKYLRKMTSMDLLGLYFITNQKAKRHPFSDKMHACFGRFTEFGQGNCVYEYSLSLESVLTASEGQLIRFEGDGVPVFGKSANTEKTWPIIRAIHMGIIEYFQEALNRFGDALLVHEPHVETAVHFFRMMSKHPEMVSASLRDALRIDDFYVSNGMVQAFHYADGAKYSERAPATVVSSASSHRDIEAEDDHARTHSAEHMQMKGNGPSQPILEETGRGAAACREAFRQVDTPDGPPTVSIVILTFNELEYTKKCVESIRRHTPEPHEIIFVDNGSKDGTVKWLKKLVNEHGHYKLIENGKNLGFAKGCNQGIEAASSDCILLLNNDVVVTEGWLAGMMECLNSAPDIGIVGPMTNNISGRQKVDKVGYDAIDGPRKLCPILQGEKPPSAHRSQAGGWLLHALQAQSCGSDRPARRELRHGELRGRRLLRESGPCGLSECDRRRCLHPPLREPQLHRKSHRLRFFPHGKSKNL